VVVAVAVPADLTYYAPRVTDTDEPASLQAVRELLDRNRLRAHRMARAQFLAGKRAESMHNLLGIPVVVLTAVVGTTIFSSLGSSPNRALVIAAGLISLLAAVLAALQTFLGFAQRAEKHRASGVAYSELKRDLDLLATQLTLVAPTAAEALAELKPLLARYAAVDKESADVADAHYDRARREQDQDDEGI
jgi:hypothetical protein